MKYWFLSVWLYMCCNFLNAQKIIYSKNVIRKPGNGFVRLISNINGYHHIIYFSHDKKPVISVFNEQLHIESSVELNIKLPDNCDVKLVQFKTHYLLYAHPFRSTKHQLIKISGNGTSTDISAVIQRPEDSVWNRSTAAFQLLNVEGNLCILSSTYYDMLKKIKTTCVKFSEENKPTITKHQLFPLDLTNESLEEITLYNNHLFFLKTGKHNQLQNILTIIKSDLASETIFTKQFESGSYIFLNPTIRYNKPDSGVFVHSIMTVPFGYKGDKSSLFMANLDQSLNEKNIVKILPNVFRYDAATSFIVEKNKTSGWINFSIMLKDNEFMIPSFSYTFGGVGNTDLNMMGSMNNSEAVTTFKYTSARDNSTAVLMTILNNQLEKSKDSLIKNRGKLYTIHPMNYSKFIMHNTPYLLLVQELTKSKKSLLLVSPSDDNDFITTSLRVYERYNYVLSLLQTAENYFIVPFTNKKEMGLMKVTLNN